MDEFDHKPQKNNPKLDVIEPSIVEDVSFSCFLKPCINREESDQISIFDAAKYFSGVHDNLLQQQRQPPHQRDKELDIVSPIIPPRLSSVSSSVETSSNARNSQSSDRTMRSFRSTPTASSEASWNSQAGLLVNSPGSLGINIIKNLTNNNSSWSRGTTTSSKVSSKWARISTKWLNRRSKCPCYGKKAVQVVEERIVHLRKITSSNDESSKTSNVHNPIHQTIENDNDESNSKVVGPLAFDDSESLATGRRRSSGFTFPILVENNNHPICLNKMFNMSHPAGNEDDLHCESLESGFQPQCLQSSKSRRASYEDNENVSDESSDLFEIESFSTLTYPRRDSIDEVIVPSLNMGSTVSKLGIICSRYSNQDRKDDNNNNNDNNNSSNVNESDCVDEESETTSTTSNACYAPGVTTVEAFDRVTLTNLATSASEIPYNAIRPVVENYDHGSGGTGLTGGMKLQ